MGEKLKNENKILTDEKLRIELELETSSPTLNRTYKDQIFRAIFKEKAQFLSLYNAVNGTAYDNPDDLTVTTVEQYVFMGMKNDVSYLVDMSLALYEHQSTDAPNSPIRFLCYFTQQLQDMIKPHQLYSTKRISLPNPQFLVFYNGKKELPESSTLRLSDSFPQTDQEPQVELIVKVLNINPGYNDELKKNCPILNEYMIFVEKVREYCKDIEAGSISEEEQKKAIGKAALKAVNWCIEHHVLEDFLTKNKRQVITMSIFEFNDEIWEQVREDDRKFAREDGFQEGRQAGLQEGRQVGLQEGRQAGLQEGRQAGLQEGRQAGLQEGRQAGLQEGRQAGLQEGHIDAIQKMLQKNFSKEVILDLGYSEEEYQKAEKELLTTV
jgi:flagellar biosynthesis/type III secretory pathway protein FliH